MTHPQVVLRGNKAEGPLFVLPLVNGRKVYRRLGWVVRFECEDGDCFCTLIDYQYPDTGRTRSIPCIMRDCIQTHEAMNACTPKGRRVVSVELLERCLVDTKHGLKGVAVRGRNKRNLALAS